MENRVLYKDLYDVTFLEPTFEPPPDVISTMPMETQS